MDDGWRAHVFDALVVIVAVGNMIVEESFATPEQDRHNHQMHLIDERSTQVLPNGGCTASDQYITVARCFEGCVESCFDPTVDEVKRCPPCISIGGRGWCVSTNTG